MDCILPTQKDAASNLRRFNVHEFERTRNGASEMREQFVAKRMGHDPDRTKYEIHRRQPDHTPEPPGPGATPPTLHAV